MSDIEISPTKRQASAVILSSDDETSGLGGSYTQPKNTNAKSLPVCKVVVSRLQDIEEEQLKKTKRKVKRKFLEDSSEEEQPIATPSKIQMPVQVNRRRGKPRRLRTKFWEDSSDEDQITPSKSKQTIHKERLEKLCQKKQIHSSTRKRLFPKTVEANEESGEMRPNTSYSDTSSDDENQFINDKESENGDSYTSNGESENADQEYKSEDENVFNDNDPDSYANPYMARNDKFEREDIMRVLSKSTEKDHDNRIRYKKEIGKYQLEIHSDKNPALYLTKTKRKKRIMRETNNDKSFKEERNVWKWDDEYYNSYVLLTILGQKVQVFPHTRVVAKSSSFPCSLKTCNKDFIVGKTPIVGIKKFSETEMKFIKTFKESFYWICASHCPTSIWLEEDSGSSTSEDE